jgi:transcriptional regulator with PAS, ATPase and Fis domain
LIESELFGHTKGAFTGAARDSIGLFRAAHGGTILLDEVIDMPLDIQAKFLRVVQERTVRPVGGLSEQPIDVRIIAATNRDPAEAVECGRLRKDLFYRLSVITIAIPPLRQRPDDVPDLIAHFSAAFAKTYGLRIGPVEQRVLDALSQYSWPGNVRELENLVEQWFALRPTGPITTSVLPSEFQTPAQRQSKETAPRDVGTIIPLRDAERALVQKALKAAGDNKSRAANLLGISRKRLYKILGSSAGPKGGEPD